MNEIFFSSFHTKKLVKVFAFFFFPVLKSFIIYSLHKVTYSVMKAFEEKAKERNFFYTDRLAR